MRLLLLLSALLSALCGVVTGAASAASGVEATLSVGEAGERRQSRVARPAVIRVDHAPTRTWQPIAIGTDAAVRPLYGDRRRE